MRGVKIHIKKNDKTMNRFMRCNEDFKMISSSNFLFLLNDIEEGFLEWKWGILSVLVFQPAKTIIF